MSIALQTIQHIQHFDTVSEASTDGDDCPNVLHCAHFNNKINLAKNKVKSSLCRNFAEKGFCPYGLKCQFAHGIDQLRCNIDENSYKTKPCNSFWKKNCCPYGFRCNFSHSYSGSEEIAKQNTPILPGYYQIIVAAKTKKSKLFFARE